MVEKSTQRWPTISEGRPGHPNREELLKSDRIALQTMLQDFFSAQTILLEEQESLFKKTLMERAGAIHEALDASRNTCGGVLSESYVPQCPSFNSHPSAGTSPTVNSLSSNSVKDVPFDRKSSISKSVHQRVTAGLRRLSIAKEYEETSHNHPTQCDETFETSCSSREKRVSVTTEPQIGQRFIARLQRCLDGRWFKSTIAVNIVLNAILIGVSSDVELKCALRHSECDAVMMDVLGSLNTFFTVLFTLELVVRIVARRLDFCRGPSAGWNLLDTVVVVVSLLEGLAAGGGIDFKYIRLMRLTRLVRTLRVVRTLPMFTTLRTMMNAIMNSASSLMWAMILIWFTLFMFAVAFTQGVAQYVEGASAAEGNMTFYNTFFSSLGMTLLTLFMSITGGVNWWEVIDAMMDISVFFAILFAFYVSLMLLALLNIVTGIFVNDALEFAKLDRELMAKFEIDRRQVDTERLRKVFLAVDISNTGKVTYEQLKVHLDSVEAKALFTVMGLDVTNEDLSPFFESLDVEGKGYVFEDEFVMGCMKLRGCAKAVDLATLMNETEKLTTRLINLSGRLEAEVRALDGRIHMKHQDNKLRRDLFEATVSDTTFSHATNAETEGDLFQQPIFEASKRRRL